jgi:AhpD family alkylhydroperoxidase
MDRKEIYQEIKETLGLVPTMFKALSDSTLELEWNLFKVTNSESAISNKNKELIGIAISAVTKCKYCVFFHTEMAKLHGATAEEVEDAVHFAKHTAGWSTYVNGIQLDYGQFKEEIKQVCDYISSQG